jgi:hypothetical protein
MALMMVVVIVVTETKSPSEGVSPSPPWVPWIIVPHSGIIGRGVVVLPEMKLSAQYQRVPVVHFTYRSDIFSQNFTRDSDPAAFAVNVGVQITVHTNQESPFGGTCGFFSPVERSLKYLY